MASAEIGSVEPQVAGEGNEHDPPDQDDRRDAGVGVATTSRWAIPSSSF